MERGGRDSIMNCELRDISRRDAETQKKAEIIMNCELRDISRRDAETQKKAEIIMN